MRRRLITQKVETKSWELAQEKTLKKPKTTECIVPKQDKESRLPSSDDESNKSMDEEEDKDLWDVPKHFKSYSI